MSLSKGSGNTMNHKYLTQVNQLFYTLFQNKGQISYKEHPELFKPYRNPEALFYIKRFEEDFRCQLISVQQEMLYLQPTMENEVFSLTDKQIQEVVKGTTKADAYLSYYICLVTLNLIYLPNISCSELQTRFTTTVAVTEAVTERLKEATERANSTEFLEENQESDEPLIYELENIGHIQSRWNFKIGGEGNNSKHKKPFVTHVFKFLEEQGLVRLVPMATGYQAYGTERLYAVMKVISYQEREQLMAKLLGCVDWTRQPDFKKEEKKEYDYFKLNE